MFDLKKLTLGLVAITSASAFAGTMGPVAAQPLMKEGLYVGAGIGGGMYSDKISAYNPIFFDKVSNPNSTSGALASIFAGVGQTYFDKYYLGVEANSYFPGHNTIWEKHPGVSVLGFEYESQYSIRNYVNLDLLPGYRVSPDWMVYGRAGISFSQVTANQEGNHLANVNTFSDTRDRTGGRFGAGIAYQLTEHVGAAVDYYYSYIPTTSFSFNDRSTVLQLDDSLNYVGFSLFYTV